MGDRDKSDADLAKQRVICLVIVLISAAFFVAGVYEHRLWEYQTVPAPGASRRIGNPGFFLFLGGSGVLYGITEILRITWVLWRRRRDRGW